MSGRREGRHPAGNDSTWTKAVAEATQHIDERREAESSASASQKPKGDGTRIVLALVALGAVVSWGVARWTATVDPLPVARERVNMAWSVVDIVETVEDFRAEHGRLPTTLEVPNTADRDVEYLVTEGGYRVLIHGDGESLTYDGAVNMDDWMAAQMESDMSEEAP